MKAEQNGFSTGDKYGLAGVAVLIAGCALYGVGTKAENGTLMHPFQTEFFLAPLIVAAVGAAFLLFSYRAHMQSWRASRGNKVVATAMILFFVSILVVVANLHIAIALAIAVSGVGCLLFVAWQGIRLRISK